MGRQTGRPSSDNSSHPKSPDASSFSPIKIERKRQYFTTAETFDTCHGTVRCQSVSTSRLFLETSRTEGVSWPRLPASIRLPGSSKSGAQKTEKARTVDKKKRRRAVNVRRSLPRQAVGEKFMKLRPTGCDSSCSRAPRSDRPL